MMQNRPFKLIEAPSNLGLQPPAPGKEPGVRGMPDALRNAGLASRLGIKAIQRVDAPPYKPAIDPITGIRNAIAIRDYSLKLAAVVEEALEEDVFPLLIGGDCSILLGSMLALRRKGNYGLCFIDGHADYLTPQSSQTGGAAGMDLALATGHGPELLTRLDGRHPLIPPSQVAVLGNRDILDKDTYAAKEIFSSGIHLYPLASVRQTGIAVTVRSILDALPAQTIDGIWIHLDLDVLDSTLMPAVDSPQPDGLQADELRLLLKTLLETDRIAGLQITIYDPDLDPDGRYARDLVEILASSLT